MKILLRLLLIMAAFWLVPQLVDGVEVTGDWVDYLVIAVVFEVVQRLCTQEAAEKSRFTDLLRHV